MLNLSDVRSMHDTMFRLYQTHFFDNTPEEWQDDPWFKESVPLIVSMKYGQDLLLDTSDDNLEQTITTFDQNYSFKHVSRWSFAIATHLR
jgi:hypothetical protein